MKKFINEEIIKNYILINKLSKSKFSKQCGISVETLNKILKSGICRRLTSLCKISKFMNVPISVLLTY